RNGPGPSRRDFLRGSGAAAAATALGEAALPAVAAPAGEEKGEVAGMGPGPVRLRLEVNGHPQELRVEPRVTLLDALRSHLDAAGKYLDVTGCKRVCDRATCGACTVMLDGKTVYSCTTLALEADGAEIKTAESLGGDKLDPVPQAFSNCDAQQCGFCTPGFVVSIRAALDKHPNA